MATVEEPVLSRLDRLDNILKQLEEMRGGYNSPKSSTASTLSSGTLTSEDFSPRSLEKHCRPIEDVILETANKGTIIERLVHIEDRLLKICLQLEEASNGGDKRKEIVISTEKSSPRKSFKQLVKSCVKGKGNHKSNH